MTDSLVASRLDPRIKKIVLPARDRKTDLIDRPHTSHLNSRNPVQASIRYHVFQTQWNSWDNIRYVSSDKIDPQYINHPFHSNLDDIKGTRLMRCS